MPEITNNPEGQKKERKDWDAEHPTLRLIATLVAIIGGVVGMIVGIISIYNYLNGTLSHSRYYDRFENSAYDGSFDPILWERGGLSGVSIEQRNGALVLQPIEVTAGDNIALFPRKLKTIPFQQFEAMEAKLKLSGTIKGTGFVKIQAYTQHNGLSWWLECNLEAVTPGKLEYWCNVEEGAYNGSTPIPAYKTKNIETTFDQWHLARFEVDDKLKGVQFYLDDQLVGQYTFPSNNSLYFAVLEPQIGSWVHPTNDFVGYFDDIAIETRP